MASCTLIDSVKKYFRVKKQKKQERQLEIQMQQEDLRQTNANGMIELALKKPFRKNSFTGADPGKFYKGHHHVQANDPWKDVDEENRKDGKEVH